MDFSLYISTPANTSEASPLISSLTLTKGRLVGGFLFFPSGPAGTLHLIAKIGKVQIIPFNTGQNYALNRCIMPLTIDIDISQPPYILDVITWNDSTTYPHALTLTLFIDPWKRPRTRRSLTQKIIDQVTGYQKR